MTSTRMISRTEMPFLGDEVDLVALEGLDVLEAVVGFWRWRSSEDMVVRCMLWWVR